MSNPLTLWAISHESEQEPCSVDVTSDNNVYQLKNVILPIKFPVLQDAGIADLRLWMFNEPLDLDPEETLFDRITECRAANGITQLRNHHELAKYWPNQPAPGLNILVTLRSQRKRSNESAEDVPEAKRLKYAEVPSSTTQPSNSANLQSIIAAASIFYDKAWGKQWPYHEGIIRGADVEPAGTIASIPGDEFKYVCFEGVGGIAKTLQSSMSLRDNLVERTEYRTLCGMLKAKESAGFVVTGHPGIGKTTFLLYLLLHRLQNRCPTAIQLDPNFYFIFDTFGAKLNHIEERDPRLERCWALADSNALVEQPCPSFQILAKCVVQTSSPNSKRWKSWITQKQGMCIVSELPTVLEIGAILKESGLDTSETLARVEKWGPSTRIIMQLAEQSISEEDLELQAIASASQICANPAYITTLSGLPASTSEGSTIVFVSPRRSDPAISSRALCKYFIPTKYLAGIFEERRAKLSNDTSLELFEALSLHSLMSPERLASRNAHASPPLWRRQSSQSLSRQF
ncbi:uncharacterized protein STEHIDRAFT_171389 [Stereum hirsutum FP-91666 SS1]|uniref:uncharacterized protein n=1 Tax=Stereum hirsutum (strain FP-91666) TaxID=721885 RepID=UPI000444A04F|nr:uncharacterized protein STEHIDRAFT_171389 [Stereum hirsutum FP-91666 SS1]EIM82488.1 hypothetical protein STEHIDRAFT_171389 [Stereum hirsutum FP-91666 SS1]